MLQISCAVRFAPENYWALSAKWYVTSSRIGIVFDCIGTNICLRPNCNVFGYIDWTTGLLLSENSSEVYLEQQQSQQHQHLLPQPPPPTALPTTIALSRPPTQSPTHPRLQPQQGLPITSPPLSLSLTPIVQLTNTSTHFTPSYTIAPTTEIVINSTTTH